MNGIFEGIMLVCDMDGTLLNSKMQISKENKMALEYFVDNGGVFTIATGRTEVGVRNFLNDLPVNAPVILYNGASIYDFSSGKVLWERCLEDDVKSVLLDLLNSFPRLGIEVFHGGDVYFLRENEETTKHEKREGFSAKVVSLQEVPEPWYKSILTADPVDLLEVEKFIKAFRGSFRTVYSEPQFLEVLHKTASKGTALEELAKIVGVSIRKTVSVGDNFNDLEMIQTAGIGFAVENANPHIKKYSNYCCCHHDEHVAAFIINWIECNAAIHDNLRNS